MIENLIKIKRKEDHYLMEGFRAGTRFVEVNRGKDDMSKPNLDY